jgi:hypothetical protein
MTTRNTKIGAIAVALAVAAGGALVTATTAKAEAAVRDAGAVAAAVADETPAGARGSITFRGERYVLSSSAVVTTSPSAIRIADDAAVTAQGARTSIYVHLGYAADAAKPNVLRISSGIAVRGYDFASGAYDASQAVQIGQSTLSIDSAYLSEATHAWGHLNSPTERGVEIDVHGIHPGSPS